MINENGGVMPDGDLLNGLLKSAVTLAIAIIGFFTKRTMDDVKDNTNKINKIELEHANYKTHVSDNYAKDATVQSSLSRIHERIDEVGEKVETGMKDIRDDIKKLIGKTGL